MWWLWSEVAWRLLGRRLNRTLSQGEPHAKAGVPGLRFDLDAASMFLYNSLDGVEAEAGSLSDGLGGEEGFEDVRFDLRRNPRTVVANLNHNTAIVPIS